MDRSVICRSKGMGVSDICRSEIQKTKFVHLDTGLLSGFYSLSSGFPLHLAVHLQKNQA